MNSSERLLTAFRRGTPDRVPVATWLSLRLLDQITGQSPKKFLDRFATDPNGSIVKIQEDLGFDPILLTFSELEDEVIDWPNRLLRWQPEAFENWKIHSEVVEKSDDSVTVRRTITTPEGQLTSAYRRERYQKWTLEHLVKEESDLELLRYRPDPKYLDISLLSETVRTVGERALVMHNFPGVWYEACSVRDLVSVSTDIYERPEWLKRYMAVLGEYLLRLQARIMQSGIKVILLDESWVGVGLSAATFNEFILPYDLKLVSAAHQAGVLADYHNCGRIKAVLEPMANTGADVLEPLLPPSLNGELWLKDVKQRVGGRIALYGGFNERVLQDSAEDVQTEVRRCIDEGAAGGGYAIRTAGQVFDATVKNLEVMTREVERYGTY
jgi:Uroporphyrinogen decarboxylase (URO-D)